MRVGANDAVTRIGHDPDAFEEFYREHIESVQRFIARRVADPHTAADLTADVFLAAIDSAGSYRASRGNAAGWLFGIARNVVAAYGKRQARETRLAGSVSGSALVDAGDLQGLEERIDAERRARELYEAMDRLSDAERAVLELVALDGLTTAEAARALRITAVAARVRLYRARAAMRRELTPLDTDEPQHLPQEAPS